MAVVATVLMAASLAGSVYLGAAALAVRRFLRRPAAGAAARPAPGAPVTVLKPLHGAEPGLYENLRSFCEQRGAPCQILFGLREADDPAVAVVKRLIGEFPGRDLALVIDPRVSGSNFKVGNLENMLAHASHDVLVIADSDMRVGPDYLAAVTAPLADPAVGLVTCLYRGVPAGGRAARLGAMFVSHGFLPSALLAEWLQPGRACFGATMALRRSTLEALGGFAPLRDRLADDNALGAAVRGLGLGIAVAPLLVDTIVAEADLPALLRHELRWARTIRLIAPLGYAASVVTHPVALGALAVLCAGASASSLAVFAVALAGRLAMVRAIDRACALPRQPLALVPLRDLLSFVVFVASFCGSHVAWRDRRFRIAADGRLVADGETRA